MNNYFGLTKGHFIESVSHKMLECSGDSNDDLYYNAVYARGNEKGMNEVNVPDGITVKDECIRRYYELLKQKRNRELYR